QHLAVAVLEGREWARRPQVARLNVLVNGPEELLEGVGEALVVAARVAGEAAGARVQQGRVADEQLVGPVAAAQPQLVGPLAVPGERSLRAGDLQADAVLAPRRHLRDREGPRRPAAEAQQDRPVILRVDGDRLRL